MQGEKLDGIPVAASVIIYHPDRSRLQECISSVLGQAEKIFLVINGRDSCSAVEMYRGNDRFSLIVNEQNEGIAKALNQAMRAAEEAGYEWVLTMDQDSSVTEGFVRQLSAYCHEPSVGIICPDMEDRNAGLALKDEQGTDYIDRCITSGALTSVRAWREAGMFTEPMFIDYVDYDLNMKMKRIGYKTLCVHGAVLHHEIGKVRILQFGKWQYWLFNHNPIRTYYFTRNVLYYCMKHKDIVNVRREKRELFFRNLMVLLFEDNKFEKLKAIIRGRRDARSFFVRTEEGRKDA